MKKIPAQYQPLAEVLKEFIQPWRTLTIGIDGVDGAGKSTLGRFLSWYLDMPVVETDLFIEAVDSYRLDELQRVIKARHSRNRPLLIEGIALLDLLKQLSVQADYLVYIENPEHEGGRCFSERLKLYGEQYKPKDHAAYVLTWQFDDTDS